MSASAVNKQKAIDRKAENVRRYQLADATRLRTNRRRSQLKRQYGITLEQYEAMLADQRGRCAICQTSNPGGPGNQFTVDHDHATDSIRALLCSRCNFVLGYARENVATLEAAICYLNKFGRRVGPST